VLVDKFQDTSRLLADVGKSGARVKEEENECGKQLLQRSTECITTETRGDTYVSYYNSSVTFDNEMIEIWIPQKTIYVRRPPVVNFLQVV